MKAMINIWGDVSWYGTKGNLFKNVKKYNLIFFTHVHIIVESEHEAVQHATPYFSF